MNISTIEQFLTREDVFTWITDGELDLPDNLADELIAKAIRETGFAFLLDALHTQSYCESFAVDLVDSLDTSDLFTIGLFQQRTLKALRDYARYICDCNIDIGMEALRKFEGRYAKDAQIINLWQERGLTV
jgi:hypothetical protein